MKTKLKLPTMLLLSFTTVTLIALLIGTAGYYGAVRNQQAMHETGSVRLPGVANLLLAKAELERIRSIVETNARADLASGVRQQLRDELTQKRASYSAALKTYEALAKTAEESDLKDRFLAALATWRTENNQALELAQQFELIGIVDPEALAFKIEQLTKDHYMVVQKVLLLLRTPENSFAGGDDHTACNAGKWLPTFQTSNPTLAAAVRDIAESHRQFHAAVGRIKGLVTAGQSAEAARIYEQEMAPSMLEVFRLFDSMRTAVANANALHSQIEAQVDGPAKRAQETTIDLLDRLVQLNREIAAGTVRDSDAQGSFLKAFCLAAMIVGTVAAATLGLVVTRAITRPIQRVTDQLTAGAGQTAAAAAQVSSSSQTLAAGASEQAASLEETGSSLEELSSMTKRNADSAVSAKGLSGETRAAAETGHADMAAMRQAMDAIKTSSSDIAKIIKSIDEIAFQTNLLALNAAVEAARAGDAGAGFAIVAEEVRALAQRSATAAKETAAKIEVAIQNGEQGVRISRKVAQSLDVIVAKARQVDELVGLIATASDEQTQGIAQINSAVSQMDQVTQGNAANAEETAAAAEELAGQSVTLNETVGELLSLIDGRQRPRSHGSVPVASTITAGSGQVRNVRPAAMSVRPVGPAGAGHERFFRDA